MSRALETVPLALSLQGVANWAQVAIAISLWLAFFGTLIVVRVTRTLARRQLAFAYFERFGSKEMIKEIEDARDFWRQHDWSAFLQLGSAKASELIMVPNLVEELATAYNRRIVDRGLIALVLGPTIEGLWEEWQELITKGQGSRSAWVYYEWTRMQVDTRTRRVQEQRKIRRRASWRHWAYGTYPSSVPGPPIAPLDVSSLFGGRKG